MIHLTQNRVVGTRTLALGVLLAALLATMLLAARPAHAQSTFTVTNNNDSGAASLRQAILDANSNATADTIKFNIPTTGVATISPDSPLPAITEPVVIDGYTQPGSSENTKASGNDAVLRIELSGADATTDYVNGLTIYAHNSTVKGLIINRWTSAGIDISTPSASGNRVTGNRIGTDATGTQDLGNSYGVKIYEASSNTVGGTTVAERNVISGNGGHGVQIETEFAEGNRVVGNYIGTASNGTAPLGNDLDGVVIDAAPYNTVGGTEAGQRNVISANDGGGVIVFGATASGNRVLSNSVFSNRLLGIDLGGDGQTANDPGDADNGPNGLQNAPVLSLAKTASGRTTIKGTLNSTPNEVFLVEFFSNPKGTREGKNLVGQTTVSTDASGNASFTFEPPQAVSVGKIITTTATANPSGARNTSEFSAPRRVVS